MSCKCDSEMENLLAATMTAKIHALNTRYSDVLNMFLSFLNSKILDAANN